MDGSRPPPQTGAPVQYAFVNRVYSRNMRPVVIATASLSALWTLLWAISEFQDINIDKGQHLSKLATFDIVLGVMYMIVCVIEIFGIVAGVTQRLMLIKGYAMLSILSCITVIAAGLVGVVLHFIFKNDLINECTTLATGVDVDFKFGWFGPAVHDTLSPAEAASFCKNGWDHDSWSTIVSLLIEIILGVLFSMFAFAYYRQSLDPTSAANAMRAPSNQIRGQGYPQHYNPPYNASVPNLGYGNGPSAYAPPAGPPPQFEGAGYSVDDLGKPPGYEGGDYGSKFHGSDSDRDLKEDHKEDPFADFEGNTKDVTSRPRPGDRDEFHV